MTGVSQTAALLGLLADGRPRSVPEIHAAIGSCRLNSRAAELRARGVQIVCERTPGVAGPEAYVYRIDAREVGYNGTGGAAEQHHPVDLSLGSVDAGAARTSRRCAGQLSLLEAA